MLLKADEGRAVGSWPVLSRLPCFLELLVIRDDAKGGVDPVGFELSAFHTEARVDETDPRGVISNPLQLLFSK